MITVYHLLQSRSERVIWLLEELGEPYELLAFKREENMAAPAAYRAIHPMGTSPIIRDGAVTLVETGAIVEYILARYGHGRLTPAPGTLEHAHYIQWTHFAEGSASMSFITEALLSLAAKGQEDTPRMRGFPKLWRDRNERIIPYLDAELGRWPYFAGDEFTAADIMMSYTFGLFEQFIRRPLTPYANILRYRERIYARPAYVRAMELAAREPA